MIQICARLVIGPDPQPAPLAPAYTPRTHLQRELQQRLAELKVGALGQAVLHALQERAHVGSGLRTRSRGARGRVGTHVSGPLNRRHVHVLCTVVGSTLTRAGRGCTHQAAAAASKRTCPAPFQRPPAPPRSSHGPPPPPRPPPRHHQRPPGSVVGCSWLREGRLQTCGLCGFYKMHPIGSRGRVGPGPVKPLRPFHPPTRGPAAPTQHNTEQRAHLQRAHFAVQRSGAQTPDVRHKRGEVAGGLARAQQAHKGRQRGLGAARPCGVHTDQGLCVNGVCVGVGAWLPAHSRMQHGACRGAPCKQPRDLVTPAWLGPCRPWGPNPGESVPHPPTSLPCAALAGLGPEHLGGGAGLGCAVH